MSALLLLLVAAAGSKNLDRGAELLAEFRAEDALEILEAAKTQGPYTRAEYVRLFEQLGVAYAYLERSQNAIDAFDMMLALDPGRAISYTLSPKVTFLFEQARSAAAERAVPTIDLRWPIGLTVAESIPIDIDVVADPKKFFVRGALRHRVKGAPTYSSLDVVLPRPGQPTQLELPPAAPLSTHSELVEVYLVAFDGAGNEVHQWGSESRPREIAVRYEPPDPWYSEWWFWAIAGTVVAAGASAAMFAATREPPDKIDGIFTVVP